MRGGAESSAGTPKRGVSTRGTNPLSLDAPLDAPMTSSSRDLSPVVGRPGPPRPPRSSAPWHYAHRGNAYPSQGRQSQTRPRLSFGRDVHATPLTIRKWMCLWAWAAQTWSKSGDVWPTPGQFCLIPGHGQVWTSWDQRRPTSDQSATWPDRSKTQGQFRPFPPGNIWPISVKAWSIPGRRNLSNTAPDLGRISTLCQL